MSSVLYIESSNIVRTMTKLSDRIKKILDDEGLIPADLARTAGVSPMAVSYWMDGTTKELKFKYAEPIAKKYGYDTRWIMTGKGPERTSAPEAEPGIDTEALQTILAMVLHAVKETENWDPEAISRLAVNLYVLYLDCGELPNIAQAMRLEALRSKQSH